MTSPRCRRRHAGRIPAAHGLPHALRVPCLCLVPSFLQWGRRGPEAVRDQPPPPLSGSAVLPHLLSSLACSCCHPGCWGDEVSSRHMHFFLKTQPFKDMMSLNKHSKVTLFSPRGAVPEPGSGIPGGWGGVSRRAVCWSAPSPSSGSWPQALRTRCGCPGPGGWSPSSRCLK